MAFVINCESFEEANRVEAAVRANLNISRFTVQEMIVVRHGKRGERYDVEIRGVRLITPKGYCGNHAGPCRVTGKKHRTLNYLEGLDWVSFNEMLNDTLDGVSHFGNAGSSHCIIRKRGCRRLVYEGRDGGEFYKDTRTEDYECYVGRHDSPPVDFPSGTPGIIGWGIECTEELYAEAI